MENINVPPWPIVVAVITLVAVVIINYFTKDKPLPPGPWGLPLLGYYPFLRREGMHLQLEELQKKYGDVFSFNLTGNLFIHLGSAKAMREVHASKSENFEAKYKFPYDLFQGGMLVMDGEPWKVLRKFFIQSLKDCGFTAVKDQNAGAYYDSISGVVSDLRASGGKPLNVTQLLTERCLHVVRKSIFGDDGISNEELREFLDIYGELLSGLGDFKYAMISDMARLFLLPRNHPLRFASKAHRKAEDILLKILQRHESTLDENHLRNALDGFLMERISLKRKGDSTAEHLTDRSFVCSMVQVVGDGIISVAMFISGIIQVLLERPEEQEKIYQELVGVMGTDRNPSVEDRSKVPYTNAFIYEAQRTTDFFPLIPSLLCTKQTTLRGYRIPKGAITLTNFWAAHHNPDFYEDPYAFRPERFVTTPGKPRPDLPVGFGVGKRACIGESFTMMEAFLFLTTIVKNFRLTAPTDGTTNEPVNFTQGTLHVCVTPRQHA